MSQAVVYAKQMKILSQADAIYRHSYDETPGMAYRTVINLPARLFQIS